MPRSHYIRKPRPQVEKRQERFCVIASYYWVPLTATEVRFTQNNQRRALRRFFATRAEAETHATMLMDKDRAQGHATPELLIVEVVGIVRPRSTVQYDFFNVEA